MRLCTLLEKHGHNWPTASRLANWLYAQVNQHRQHPPVGVLGVVDVEGGELLSFDASVDGLAVVLEGAESK
jgi:hypothetical protein